MPYIWDRLSHLTIMNDFGENLVEFDILYIYMSRDYKYNGDNWDLTVVMFLI